MSPSVGYRTDLFCRQAHHQHLSPTTAVVTCPALRPRCPHCGAPDVRWLEFTSTFNGFDSYQCEACGNAWTPSHDTVQSPKADQPLPKLNSGSAVDPNGIVFSVDSGRLDRRAFPTGGAPRGSWRDRETRVFAFATCGDVVEQPLGLGL